MEVSLPDGRGEGEAAVASLEGATRCCVDWHIRAAALKVLNNESGRNAVGTTVRATPSRSCRRTCG